MGKSLTLILIGKETMPKEVKICANCVRNINSEFIKNDGKQCIYCCMFEKHRTNFKNNFKKLEGSFGSKLETSRGKGRYDCLVMVSGGKDSIMTLYKIKQFSKIRILAYTLDNGFEPEEAIENIKKAVEKLEIDWILDKPRYMKKVLKTIIKDKIKISFCRFCAHMMVNRAIKTAETYQIRHIVTGWNKGQSDREPSRFALWRIDNQKIKELIKKYPFMSDVGLYEKDNENLLQKTGIEIISPWIAEKRQPEKNMEIIRQRLNWKKIKISYPKDSTSCYLNLLQVIMSRKNFGYTHYDCEESLLVNLGEKTRKQALNTLDYDIDLSKVKEVIKNLSLSMKEIGLTNYEIEKYSHFYHQ